MCRAAPVRASAHAPPASDSWRGRVHSCGFRPVPSALRPVRGAHGAAGGLPRGRAACGCDKIGVRRVLVRWGLIELLIFRGSTPCSVMHTAATVIVPHTANGVAHEKRWAMEDAVFSSRPRLYGSARSKKKRQESSFGQELSTTGPDLLSHIRVSELG
jgi:hypothetical protein